MNFGIHRKIPGATLIMIFPIIFDFDQKKVSDQKFENLKLGIQPSLLVRGPFFAPYCMYTAGRNCRGVAYMWCSTQGSTHQTMVRRALILPVVA